MLGTVLKVYREVRQGADRDWLNRLWGRLKRLMLYIENRWDPDRDGVLTGKQPNTYDISFYGANMFIGGLWLAALQAAEQMALLQEDMQFARDMRETFERGSAHYDALLWNGEYYIQVLEPDEATEFQYGDGCLSDQLLGQWWAHLLDLGYILPRDHVVTALESIWRYNLRRGFSGFEHNFRVFADCEDSGLLVCTWPHGGRPEVPIRYADEVWTGIEYQVASHAIIEGLVDEGFEIASALRARYAGDRRNPYNEIECGDHYVRSMAGWSLLEAVSGFRYNAVDGSLRFAPVTSDAEVRLPFLTGTGWGTFEQSGSTPWEHVVLRCAFGEISIQSIALPHGMEPGADSESITVTAGPHRVPAQWYDSERTSLITFEDPVLLRPGTQLEIVAER
jgi:uncharacterized protein (DUF608 family)